MIRGLDDFLILESLIRARIEERLPELERKVRLVNDPSDVIQKAAAVTVWIAPGITRMETDRSGRALDCLQRWQVILAVRNVSRIRSGRPARSQAGPIVSRLLDALSGWQPGSPFGPLRAVTPQAAPFADQGVFFYPLEFETRFAYQARTPMEQPT